MNGKKYKASPGEIAMLKLFQKVSDERVLELQQKIRIEEMSKADGNKS